MKKQIQHIAFIMDGNRRWARGRGLPTLEGHRRGKEKVKEVAEWCIEAGIPYMTIYAFSTENWKRATEEVGYLMTLLAEFCAREVGELNKHGVRIRFVGQRDRLSARLRELTLHAEQETKNNTALMLHVCLSYGGRQEIVHAAQEAARAGEITEEAIGHALWTAGAPDPDLIVRTSGEQRLSNFLLWQAAYAELAFIMPHWPAFSRNDFDTLLVDYNKRARRFGG